MCSQSLLICVSAHSIMGRQNLFGEIPSVFQIYEADGADHLKVYDSI